ncbi:glycosyltransferase [Neptunitalea lumnitzerae]|nr:glycosyltransferase [Neptunitalea sp. Y10]
MNLPLVSIIIPTYNRANLLRETLDSVFNQTYSNWECIVIDDGSSDDTFDLMKEYQLKDSRFQFYKRPDTILPGGNGARNYGFTKSKGGYINWFDSDDIMHTSLLEKKMEAFMKNQNLCYCLCQMRAFQIDRQGKVNWLKTTQAFKEKQDLFVSYIRGGVSLGSPTIIWKRTFLDPNNLFDEKLKQSQDLEFNSKYLFKQAEYAYINEPLIFYRKTDISITLNFYPKIEKYLDSYLEVRRRILKFDPLNLEVNLVVLKSILGVFRYCVSKRKFKLSDEILKFIHENNNDNSLLMKLKLYRIHLFYLLFRIIRKGDTKFKNLLKL